MGIKTISPIARACQVLQRTKDAYSLNRKVLSDFQLGLLPTRLGEDPNIISAKECMVTIDKVTMQCFENIQHNFSKINPAE